MFKVLKRMFKNLFEKKIHKPKRIKLRLMRKLKYVELINIRKWLTS